MPRNEANKFFMLDSRQGLDAAGGWRVQETTNLQLSIEGLQLAKQPSPPVPLKDDAGTFGGMENPTGVAVDSDGVIYVADSSAHLIYKIVRREGLRPHARFFRIEGGRHANDRFVYVPTANRLELWPRSLERDPQHFSEVVVVCENVFSAHDARRRLLAYAALEDSHGAGKACCADCAGSQKSSSSCSCTGRREGKTSKQNCGCASKKNCGCSSGEVAAQGSGAVSIDKEWEDMYPAGLPAGEICETSIEYLSCLGGLGDAPRQFNEPRGLSISASGDLYVADTKNHRVQVFALHGRLALRAVWGKSARAADVVAPPPPVDRCVPDEAQAVRLGQPIGGDAPGEFREPWDVATDGEGNVYVADRGNARVQKYERRRRRFKVIDGTTLCAYFFQVLYGPSAKDRFVFIPARQRLERWPHSLGHDPQDISETVVVNAGVTTLEDARRQVLNAINAVGAPDILVEWKRAYPSALAAFPQPEPAFSSPSHLAVDGAGRLYVVDTDTNYVKFLDGEGRVLGRVEFTEDVSADFQPTAIAFDGEGKLVLAGEGGAHRFDVEGSRPFYDDFYSAWRGHHCRALAVDAAGKLLGVGAPPALGVAELKAPQGYLKSGTYLSRALDSEIENCQWHKLLLDLPFAIPTGTSITVWTHSSPVELLPQQVLELADEEWLTAQTNAEDFLVLSPPGRFLQLKIEFRGNGVETPLIAGVRAHFPRQSYLQYLPAIYHADPVSKDFLERFLSIFENILGGIEETVDNLSNLFDPEGAPAEPRDFLSWLAGWVDMAFDPSWSTETRRSLLRHAPELYRRRGTPEGLKMLLRLALGIDVQILEHFQLRRWLFLSSASLLGERSQLWGNCIVNRLQLNEHSRIGDFALTGAGDPLRDPFFIHAHKFSVFVQAGLVRSPLVERMLRHLVEEEKPAHTDFELVKVEPRFRVGVQSTLGVDTQVGVYPRLVLNQCSTLGYDSLLGCDPALKGRRMLQVGEQARVGVSTALR